MSELLNSLSFYILVLSLVISGIRMAKGPHPVDRILVLDLLAVVTGGLLCVHAVQSDQSAFLDVVLVLSIIGFLGTIVFARYIERLGVRPGKEE
jgi:multicomponent Na+:H+ antiporter subunit F